MDLKNIPSIYIVLAVLAIAVVIILFLSSRKAEAGNGGNGGNGGDEDLINTGTSDYIEVSPSNSIDGVRVVWYNQPTQGLTGSDVTDFDYWIGSWLTQGLINQTQHDNAIAQFENLGF